MKKYLIIDGNNLAVRCSFANEELSNQNGIPTGVHFGFLNSLITLREKFSKHQMLIVWDGKSKRRMEESQEGVKKGIVPSAYKANRIKDATPQPLLDFYEQAPFLKKGIAQTGIPQIRLCSYEADDIAGSYAKQLDGEVVLVTSDKDYYQLLSDNVSVWDGMKEVLMTEQRFKKSYGITPIQHVDVGALMGDSSDNIISVPSLGEKTAIKLIQEHGNWEGVVSHLKKLYEPIRKQYPDVKGKDFEKLKNIRTPAEQKKFDEGKDFKGKYPDINENMTYTGVALALETGIWKPDKNLKAGIKVNLLALMHERRIALASSLKNMDTDISELPPISNQEFNRARLLEYLDYYDIHSLKESIGVFEKV